MIALGIVQRLWLSWVFSRLLGCAGREWISSFVKISPRINNPGYLLCWIWIINKMFAMSNILFASGKIN